MEQKPHRKKLATHFGLLFFFTAGAVMGTMFCHLVGKAIWIAALPLGVVFAAMLHADLTTEKDLVEEQKPSGH
jgi:uncharacterized membrane protein YoaK (UPF0700 family)